MRYVVEVTLEANKITACTCGDCILLTVARAIIRCEDAKKKAAETAAETCTQPHVIEDEP